MLTSNAGIYPTQKERSSYGYIYSFKYQKIGSHPCLWEETPSHRVNLLNDGTLLDELLDELVIYKLLSDKQRWESSFGAMRDHWFSRETYILFHHLSWTERLWVLRLHRNRHHRGHQQGQATCDWRPRPLPSPLTVDLFLLPEDEKVAYVLNKIKAGDQALAAMNDPNKEKEAEGGDDR